MSIRALSSWVSIAVVASLIAACGERASPPEESALPEADTLVIEPEATPPTSPPGAEIGDPGVITVDVTLDEWSVAVSPSRIGAGAITFAIRNEGEVDHAVEIVREEGGTWRSSVVRAGASVQMSVRLSPGTYEVRCPVGDGAHAQRGMRTSLIVE